MPISKMIFVCLLIAVVGCRQKDSRKTSGKTSSSKSYTSPPEYDLNHPLVFNLRSELDEISGLTYYPKDTSVFAICDDKGWLYKIHLTGTYKIEKWKFSKGEDFEDIVLKDNTFYALASSGQIVALKFLNNKPLNSNTYSLNLDGINEFETLYKDSASGKLVMICKDCEDDTRRTVSAYAFDPSTIKFSDTPYISLNAQEISDKLGLGKTKFKPSAATINPLNGTLYILSSVNKALVTADAKGNIKDAYNLNPKLYKQPEGITFTPSGDLIISNESADIGAANIFIIKLKTLVK